MEGRTQGSIGRADEKLDPAVPADAEGDAARAAAVERWSAERDALHRGLVHALSNRAGTVSAVAGMLMPERPIAAPIVAALQEEAARLEDLLALFRLLPADGASDAEALWLPDFLPPLLVLHGHHPTLRDVPCALDVDAGTLPVVVPAEALARAVLLLVSNAKRGPDEPALRVAPIDGGVALHVTPGEDDAGAADATRALLGEHAETTADAGGVHVRFVRVLGGG